MEMVQVTLLRRTLASSPNPNVLVAFSALILLVGGRKGIRPVKNGRWWRWALVSQDRVAPSQMVGVSASVDLPLHHKVNTELKQCRW